MDLSKQKEQFSLAVVHAIASVARVTYQPTVVDLDSVDVTFSSREIPSRPKLDAQVKCTSQPITKGGELRYPLPVKNYNDLRETEVLVPRILIVVLVPSLAPKWLNQTEKRLWLQRSAWYTSLLGSPPTTNTDKVTIPIPLGNLFTTAALRQCMGLP